MYIFKRNLILIVFIFCGLQVFGQFPGGGRSGGINQGGGPQQTNFQDTTQRPPFAYTAFDLHNLRGIDGVIDTLIDDLHKLEPYYQQSPIGGNLGSEYSSSFGFFYDYNPSPLALGQEGHRLLLEDQRARTLFSTNRDFFETVYSTSNPIGGKQFKLSYYKPFARRIIINFNYSSYTDNGIFANQLTSFKQLNLKLYQKSKSSRRMTYIHYHNPRISEGIARIPSEAGTVSDQRRKIEIGNSILVGDSLSIQQGTKHIDSRLTFSKDLYSLTDATVTETDSIIYQFRDSTLSLEYLNHAQRITFNNSYHQPLGQGKVKAGFDLSFVSTKADTVKLQSYIAPQIYGSYEQPIGNSGSIGLDLSMGFADISGDIRSSLLYTSRFKAVEYNVGVAYDMISPTLSRRFLYANQLRVIDYGLSTTNRLKLSGQLQIKRIGLEVKSSYQQYTDLILPDITLGWQQHSESISIAQLSIKKKLNFGILKSSHQLHLQSISDNELLPRPKLQYHGNAYINLKLFKKRMDTQWGIEAYFIPSYSAPAFQPLWGEWYQNADPYDSDHIILINPYLNIKVDRLFFFVKGINTTREFLPQNPSWGGNYAIFNYRVRFGIRWTLLD